MSTYAIGDVQGCYDTLLRLLDKITYQPKKDTLWLAGDLINRGPKSLQTLRFIQQQLNVKVVLGNHDLHCLMVAENLAPAQATDTLAEILSAPDRDALLTWLRQQPLLHHDASLNITMVHAGILPIWTLSQARAYANEVEKTLQSQQYVAFLQHLYGDEPICWNETLTGWNRLRFITNVFTRLRFCSNAGCLELTTKTSPDQAPPGFMPWFSVPNRKTAQDTLVFGHWAALMGQANQHNVYALDTGCVWGGKLTALRLEDKQLFSVSSK